jgi:Reverse transcriptase (RNA-dependent DNA polymerase)
LSVDSSIEDRLIAVAVYVNDLKITADVKADGLELKDALSERFKISDEGPLNHILGVEVRQFGDTRKICQTKYIEMLIQKYPGDWIKPIHWPIFPGTKMKVEGDGDVINASWYRRIVGSLLYLSTFTRPDFSYFVNYYLRFIEKPLSSYCKGIIRVLQYVARTKDLSLEFCCCQKSKGSPYAFKIYSDADLGVPTLRT